MNKLAIKNIGIIGCGLIGNKRGLAAKKLGVNIKSVFDLITNSSEKLANELNAKVANNIEEIIKDKSIDTIVISTTHEFLSKISIDCINNNKNVLVEKPAGINFDQVKKIYEVSKTKSKFVKVGYNYRFHPSIVEAIRLVNEGKIGDIMYIRARHGHGARIGYEKEWRADKKKSGGGELLDQGSHLIDLSNLFINDLIVDYSSLNTYFWNMKVEDNCFFVLSGKNNAKAWIHVSWTEWKNLFSFEIFGRTGKIDINGFGGSYGTETLTYYKMKPEMGPPEKNIITYNQIDKSWEKEFENFNSSILNGERPFGDILDALNNWKIIDKIYGN